MPGMQPTLAWLGSLSLVVAGHAHSILERYLRQPCFGGHLEHCSHPLWMDAAPVLPLLWFPPQPYQADRHCLTLLPPQEPGWSCTSSPQQREGREAVAEGRRGLGTEMRVVPGARAMSQPPQRPWTGLLLQSLESAEGMFRKGFPGYSEAENLRL